jgi:hypothetical protein
VRQTEASLAAATAAAAALGGTHMVESIDCAPAEPTAAPDLEGAPLAGRSPAARYLDSVGGLHDGIESRTERIMVMDAQVVALRSGRPRSSSRYS